MIGGMTPSTVLTLIAIVAADAVIKGGIKANPTMAERR
jgi:hypothetical protein